MSRPGHTAHVNSVDLKKSMDRVNNTVKTTTNVLRIKAAQSVEVSQLIIDQGLVHTSLVLKEVDWFFNRLGIDDAYFLTTPVGNMAKHISSLYAGKILARATSENDAHEFKMRQEEGTQAFFAVRSQLGSRLSQVYELERMIDARYLMEGYDGTATCNSKQIPYRIKVFRSTGPVSDDINVKLRFYLLHCPKFNSETDSNETSLEAISDQRMWEATSDSTHKIYQRLIDDVSGQLAPSMCVEKTNLPGQRRLVIAYHQGSVHSFFSSLTDLYHQCGLYAPKKFVEQFKNGVSIISIYLRPVPVGNEDAAVYEEDEKIVDERINRVLHDATLIYVLARTTLTPLFSESVLTAQEASYAYAAWKFSHQFLSRYRREYSALLLSIEKNDPSLLGHLLRLKQNLRKDTFTEQRLFECIVQYPPLLKALYADFACHHGESARGKNLVDGVHSHQRDMSVLENLVLRCAKSEFDQTIFSTFINFNRYVLKTNFYKQKKIALAFRLHPGFLSCDEYPNIPYGIFFIVGSVFRGFHVRFDDVARGGIRIIHSRNPQAYAHNVGSVFDENYNLASTQQRKNKDIPEGGSKGTIFLSLNHQDKAEVAFKQYVDSLLDLLLPNEEIVNYSTGEEILFLGPDEGTADFMDWASQRARQRGAHFWKAFTTGKSVSLGGIPHDMFGMTTRSVHQYVLGVLEKLGYSESSVTKFQTGGPDGDLGSNEILISCDRTCSIVDGSGVLHDPEGIDREELVRLAKNRQMSCHFDKSKLSSKGFFVHIDDRDVTLPEGTMIENGLFFRNSFHLNKLSAADMFVPCGGRPEAINLNNVEELIESDGKPRFKVIVEGANLFITQEARLRLEKMGVVIYKDASANKGGVTSSSLEVLAALALTDEQFEKHMMVLDGRTPEFYSQYVKDVQAIIEANARLEFECIWREHELTGTPRCILSDIISNKINALNHSLRNSSMWDNEPLVHKVIADACPESLINLVGIQSMLKRVPESYIRAIFGAHLAAEYLYKFGPSAPEFAFFEFMQNYLGKN